MGCAHSLAVEPLYELAKKNWTDGDFCSWWLVSTGWAGLGSFTKFFVSICTTGVARVVFIEKLVFNDITCKIWPFICFDLITNQIFRVQRQSGYLDQYRKRHWYCLYLSTNPATPSPRHPPQKFFRSLLPRLFGRRPLQAHQSIQYTWEIKKNSFYFSQRKRTWEPGRQTPCARDRSIKKSLHVKCRQKVNKKPKASRRKVLLMWYEFPILDTMLMTINH